MNMGHNNTQMSTITQLQQTLSVSTIGYVSVVAQHYSSFAFLSLRFYLRKEKVDACFEHPIVSIFLYILKIPKSDAE
jgi:hypothetical protein